MPLVKMEEQELLLKAKAREQDAWNLLVAKYRSKLFSYAYRLLGNYDDAEDTVQTVLLKAYEHLHDTSNELNLNAWLYRITHNESINRLKGRILPEPRPKPTGSTELQKTLEEELYKLPKSYKPSMILRFLQHLKYEEIAEALDLPINTVKTNIARGLKILKERVKVLEV